MAPVAVSRYDPSQFNSVHSAKTANGAYTVSRKNSDLAQYQEFLPTWNPDEKFPPLNFFKHFDKGVLGDVHYENLFHTSSDYKVKKVTPKFGTEVRGIQLSQLTDEGKNDLARLIAERGVVIFREQDIASYGPQFIVDFGNYFGPLHKHPTSGTPDGFPEIHVTFRGLLELELHQTFATRTNNIQWHSDVSYELQPPHYTFFSVLQGPESGGDTLFADTVEAYKRLSPAMQSMLEGLHILHTSEDQANSNKQAGGVLRRDPVSTIHPLVRQHPVTKEKYLFLNREFGRKIVELKGEESDSLLGFLNNLVENSHDLQLRASWEPNTVVMWDNRRTIHTPVMDWDSPVIRHAFRISAQGERPVEDLKDLNKEA